MSTLYHCGPHWRCGCDAAKRLPNRDMFDRRTIIATIAAVASSPSFARRPPPTDWFDRAIIIDGMGGSTDPYSPDEQLRLSDRAWAETVASGVTAKRDTVLPVGNRGDLWGRFRDEVAYKHNLIQANSDRLLLIRSAADILRAKRERKFGMILGTQDSSMVGEDLDRLAQMKADGILLVQLTYNNRNLAGDGAIEPANAGLSELGRATIERIEAERILLDLSHGGARTMAEAAAHSTRPLVISHTGARALNDHPRNTDDETMRAVATKGGVIGIYFMPYLTANSQPTGRDLLAHVDHVANVAGEDHVAIGTDNGVLPTALDPESKRGMDAVTLERIKRGIAAPGDVVGSYSVVAEYNSVDRYRRFAEDLGKRGWSQARLEKLMGRNLLRLYREVWAG